MTSGTPEMMHKKCGLQEPGSVGKSGKASWRR